MTSFKEKIRNKNWFADDEYIEGPKGDPLPGTVYWWKTETYITAGQLELAFEDDDVTVGDIELNRGRITLYEQSE